MLSLLTLPCIEHKQKLTIQCCELGRCNAWTHPLIQLVAHRSSAKAFRCHVTSFPLHQRYGRKAREHGGNWRFLEYVLVIWSAIGVNNFEPCPMVEHLCATSKNIRPRTGRFQWSGRQQHQSSTIPVQIFGHRLTDVSSIYSISSIISNRSITPATELTSFFRFLVANSYSPGSTSLTKLFHPINFKWRSDVILIFKARNSKWFDP